MTTIRKLPDGGPAFPVVAAEEVPTGCMGHTEWRITSNGGGMSLRDYFAAKAIQGLLAYPNVNDNKTALERCPKIAYAVADAMLKARGE